MRKRGIGLGRTVLMNEVMSSRTRVVGPVSPFSDGFVTERPHPLSLLEGSSLNEGQDYLWSNV